MGMAGWFEAFAMSCSILVYYMTCRIVEGVQGLVDRCMHILFSMKASDLLIYQVFQSDNKLIP